jgi:hypothetical protein
MKGRTKNERNERENKGRQVKVKVNLSLCFFYEIRAGQKKNGKKGRMKERGKRRHKEGTK